MAPTSAIPAPDAPISPPDRWALIQTAYCDTDEPLTKLCPRFGISDTALYARIKREAWPKRCERPGYVNPFAKRTPVDGEPPPPSAEADPTTAKSTSTQSTATKSNPAKPKPAKPNPSKTKTTPSQRARLKARREQSRKALAQRLYNALDLKLTQLEQLMANETETTTVDQGRQTRAISALIKAFERVTEYDPELLKSTTLAGLTDAVVLRHAGPGHTSSASPIAPAHDTPPTDAHGLGPAGGASTPDSAATQHLRRDIAGRIERLLAKRNAARDPERPELSRP